MAGGGRVSIDALAICRRGVRNVLAHLGVVEAPPPPAASSGSRVLGLPGTRAYVYATADGVFEPFHENGATVAAGQPAGRIHFTWDPARQPALLHYAADGIVYGRRQTGRVRPGNFCVVVAAPYGGASGGRRPPHEGRFLARTILNASPHTPSPT